MQRRHECLGVVERRLVQESHKGAIIEYRRVGLDRLELVTVFEHRMRDRPRLNIRSPSHQSGTVPKSDRFAVPLRDFLNMFPSDHDLTHKIRGDTGKELDDVYVHRQLEVSSL